MVDTELEMIWQRAGILWSWESVEVVCVVEDVWLLLFVLDCGPSGVKIPRNYRKFENQQLYEHTKYHPTDGIFYRRKKSF